MTAITTRDGATLHCQDQGAGPPVVLLASWSLPGASWRHQTEALLAAGFRCLTYDRRGHGASPDPGGPMDFSTLADDLEAVLEAHDIRDATAITFSAGSGEAVRHLTRHGGNRIARLAMIAPTTPLLARRDDHPEGIDPAIFRAFIQEELRPDWRGWLDRNARPFAGPEVPQAELDWLIGLALQASPRALEAFHAALTTTDFREDLPRLRLPVLVLQGDRDETCPLPLTGQATAALIPGARLSLFEGAPHGLPLSHRARLNAELLAFATG
ncbi:alpha/beta fold hydrolase [Roseomonas sp. 18066]|uniref:alpha/beta fold hydrolase n=1 Tax=Roseomonas sp. 18066 TaxID=2681412 RepID=UPI001359D78B|nr:alpha/beta hydrolase [Roseomonas sp. 18066]